MTRIILTHRQGEIGLAPISNIPEGYEESEKFSKILLGIGETGNAHVLIGQDIQWLMDAIDDINVLQTQGAKGLGEDARVFVNVPNGGQIEHSDSKEGHEVLDVAPGLYEVKIKKEQLPGERRASFIND